MIEITKHIDGGITILQLRGRLDAVTAARFESIIVELLPIEIAKICVDCSAMDYVSSAGLRLFLVLAKKSKEAGGRLVIHSLQDSVSKVFEMTGFSKILEVFADERTAGDALGN